MTEVINSLSQEAQNYINDALNYLEKINNEKYKFQITNDGLKYINEKGESVITKDQYQISNILARMICDDYYYTVNMPTSNYDKFSSGTEEDEETKKLNQDRKDREAHGPTHVYGATMFVNEMLDKLQFNPELTLRDKIIAVICTLMHDSCRKGEGKDYWDKDSAILTTKLLEHFGMNTEEDKEYLKEIMVYVGDKDGSEGWKIEDNDTEKQKKAKMIATVVDLGDTEEILRARDDSFGLDFFFNKIEKIENNIIDYTIEKKQELVKSLARHHYILSEVVGIGTNEISTNNQELRDAYLEEVKRISKKKELKVTKQRQNGHLKAQDIIFERSKIILKNPKLSEEFEEYKNLSMEEKLKLYLYEEAKIITTKDNDAFFYLRNENLYLLLNSCGLIEKNSNIKPKEIKKSSIFTKESGSGEYLGNISETITYTLSKVQINGKNYIIMETLYNNRKVSNFDDSKIYKEFKIFKDNGIDLNTIDETKFGSVEYPFKDILQEIDNNDLQNFFNVVPNKLIEKEKEFQLNRLKRLYPFIEGLFDEELSNKLKSELEISITNLLDNNLPIKEKFKSKEQLANILKLIKTAYKGNKKFTDHFLMLNDICESKTEEELSKAIQHTLRYTALREFYKERTKLIPLKYSENNLEENEKYINQTNSDNNLEENEKYINQTIFRGIGIEKNIDEFDIEQAFGRTANPNMRLFDFYHTIGYPMAWKGGSQYIERDRYMARMITSMNGTRGNITSYSIDSRSCIQHYAQSGGAGERKGTNFLFVIQPNKDLYDIFGKVDGALESGCGHDFEVNAPDVEISDVAFALKFENDKISDVIFNKNFNGEFYINGKLVSEEELKNKICIISSNINELAKFLDSELKMERIIDKNMDINTSNNKDKLNQIPNEFQDKINKNINNTKILELINEMLYVYNTTYEEEKKQDIINLLDIFNDKKELNKEQINNIKNILLKKYLETENSNKLIKYYDDYLDKIEEYNISDINRIILEKEKNNIYFLINLLKRNYEKTGNINNDILFNILCNELCNEDVIQNINKTLNLDINDKIKEIIKNNYESLLNYNLNSDILIKFFDLIDNKTLLHNNMKILRIIVKQKNFSLHIYKKFTTKFKDPSKFKFIFYEIIINKKYKGIFLDKDVLQYIKTCTKQEKITINNKVYNSWFEAILNNENCTSSIINNVIKNINKEDFTKPVTINGIKYNSLIEAVLNNKKCDYNIISSIAENINKENFTKPITINGIEYDSLIEAILNNENCTSTAINNIVKNINKEDFTKPVTINGIKYNSLIEAVLNNKKCDYNIISSIAENINKENFTKPITINGIEYDSLIEAILNNENCTSTAINNIVKNINKEDFTKPVTINSIEYNSLIEAVLNNKKCDYNIISSIAENINKEDFTKPVTINSIEYNSLIEAILNNENCTSSIINNVIKNINKEDFTKPVKINGIEYNSLIEAVLNNKKCDYNIISSIVENINEEDFTKPVKINGIEYNSLIEAVLNNKKCDYTIISSIAENINKEDFTKPVTINGIKYNSLIEAVLNNENCNNNIINSIVGKMDKKDLLKHTTLKVNNIQYSSLIEATINKIKNIAGRKDGKKVIRKKNSLDVFIAILETKEIDLNETYFKTAKKHNQIIKVDIDNKEKIINFKYYSSDGTKLEKQHSSDIENTKNKQLVFLEYIKDTENNNILILKFTEKGKEVLEKKIKELKINIDIEKTSKIIEKYFKIDLTKEEYINKNIEEVKLEKIGQFKDGFIKYINKHKITIEYKEEQNLLERIDSYFESEKYKDIMNDFDNKRLGLNQDNDDEFFKSIQTRMEPLNTFV